MSLYDEQADAPDQATSRRLARLRTMPVEMRRLEGVIRAAVPPVTEGEASAGARWSMAYFLRPMRAAALLVLVATIALLLLMNSSGAALASTEQMARMHEDL